MAKLFKEKIIKQRLENFQIPNLEGKIEAIQSWYDSQQNKSLLAKKEEELEGPFGNTFFSEILGYVGFEGNKNYTRKYQPKAPEGGQKADLGLGYFDDATGENLMKVVVELKGAKISLDAPQKGHGGLTPVQQGFKYKPFFKSCDFVIVSNFIETRLFYDNYNDYESWTLSDLVNPNDNYYNFRKFYYLLCEDNLITRRGESRTKKLLSDIRVEQESITKAFYKEYSQLRKELYRDLLQNNADENKKVTKEKAKFLLEKAQKIIDRLIFIHFCEDKDLLPQGKLKENVMRAEEIGFSPWEMLKKFFEFVNSGSKSLGIPEGYNGGLFAQDTELDALNLGDDICRKFIDLGRYDFEDDLSVNILGHIFEQSISDIEELKEKIDLEESLDGKVSKRKKDGIFYTPEYIVDYIVRNSVGKKIEDWEQELKEKHKFKDELIDANYTKRAVAVYEELRQKVQQITVLDPACGSGAFLVKVFDFLLEKNKEISKKLEELTGTIQMQNEEYFKTILQNNIYGVDLNDESVDITRLSLWLKTAHKGRKLANLDKNIKCGNSLIDDPAIAGDKAFNWQQEFPHILQDGGFDVIVGNPPYGAQISRQDQTYYIEKYTTAFYKLDTYSLFIEKSIKLLKDAGFNAFIVPYTWMSIGQHKKLRDLILQNTLNQIVDLPLKVFESADLDTVIYILSKNKNNNQDIEVYNIDNQNFTLKLELDINSILSNSELLINLEISKNDLKVLEKIKINNETISDNFKVSQGLIPYDKYRGHTPEQIKGRVFHSDKYSEEFSKKELRGEDISRYRVMPNNDLFINYGSHLAAPRDQNFFTQPRILIREITRGNFYKLYATYSDLEYYNTPVMINIIQKNNVSSLKYILALLNSRLYTYYHLKSHSKAVAKTSIPKILVGEVRAMPIKNIPLSEQTPFIEKADFMLENNKLLQEKTQKFLGRVQGTFSLEKLSKKLQAFYELSFAEFVKELEKNKVKLSLKDQDEWEEYFESYKKEVLELKAKIDACDREIDEMVFDLYGLSEEERVVVLGY